jgi:hypothetical protein
MVETTADQVGRATAMVTLALHDHPNIDSLLVPLARLGQKRMLSELFGTLRAMALLASELAGYASERSGETPQEVVQRVSAAVQAQLLNRE